MDHDSVMEFCQNDLPHTLLATFSDMKEKKELCDITVRIRNSSFPAHRVILAAGIPFFRSLLQNTEPENGEIVMHDLDPRAVACLINFSYSSKVIISIQNVEQLLLTSKFLGLNKVFDACVDFVLKRLHYAKVLNVCKFAYSLKSSKLIQGCYSFIRERFEVLSKYDDFLNLPEACVREIISADDLNVPNEEIVVEAVMKWTKSSPSERHDILPRLLNETRLIYVSINYLFGRICGEELIRNSMPCRDLLDQVKEYHLRRGSRFSFNLKTQPRKFYARKEGFYAICHRTFEHSIYYCDFIGNTWSRVAYRAENNKIFKVAAVNEKIYLFLESTIQTLDLKTLQWQTLEPTHNKIGGAYALSYRCLIYFFGSYDADMSGRVRRFNTERNIWMEETNMRTARWGPSAVHLGESIFITGGYCGQGYLCTVEKYNPITGHWEELSPMLTARGRHESVALGGKIYVCGGWTSKQCPYISTTEKYDPLADQWIYVSSMKIKRMAHSLNTHDRKIYALGGFTVNNVHTREVEIYDPETDQWKSGFSVPDGFIRAVSIT